MNDFAIKRRLADAVMRVVNSRSGDVEGVGLACAALGDLLGAWTGQEVRILICAEGQSEAIDMTKTPPPAAPSSALLPPCAHSALRKESRDDQPTKRL